MPVHAEFSYIDFCAVFTLRSEYGNVFIYQEHLALSAAWVPEGKAQELDK